MAVGVETNETLLIVEDQPEVCEVVTSMLRGFGFRALSASTPSEALEIAADPETHIDLLITDDCMPEMRGPELADRIRILRPDICVLFMTGSIENERLESYPEADLIEKPFHPHELRKKVRDVLDARRAA
jgi:CheY-like chemotaxis protein